MLYLWNHQTGSGLVVKVNIKIKGQRSCYIYGTIKQIGCQDK